MVVIALSLIFFTAFSYVQSHIECRTDGIENRSLIKFKDKKKWGWSLRFILGLSISIPFFFTQELPIAIYLTVVNGTALMFYLVFIHGSFYQMWIKKFYGIGRGFTADSMTPKSAEQGWMDKHLPDTWDNRFWFLMLYIFVTGCELIYLSC
jgi:hypothetical protein